MNLTESPPLVTMVLAVLYIVPAVTACRRSHRNAEAICALNILLGWTILGWAVALIWALCNDTKGTASRH